MGSAVGAGTSAPREEACSSRCAPLVLGQLQRPVAERERVVGLQSHNVACGRGDGTAGPYISRIRTGVFHKQRRRTRMKGWEAHSQLGKTGAYGETDLDIVLLGFVCSRSSQLALGTAHVSSSSRARQHAARSLAARSTKFAIEHKSRNVRWGVLRMITLICHICFVGRCTVLDLFVFWPTG